MNKLFIDLIVCPWFFSYLNERKFVKTIIVQAGGNRSADGLNLTTGHRPPLIRVIVRDVLGAVSVRSKFVVTSHGVC